MLSLILAAVLSLPANHIIAGGQHPCFTGPAHVYCAASLNAHECNLLRAAAEWVNDHVDGAFQFGGRTHREPGDKVGANVLIVGYDPNAIPSELAELEHKDTVAVTSMFVLRETQCAAYTFISVKMFMDDFTEDGIVRVFAHELLHTLGVDHNSMPNSLMYPSGPTDYLGDPELDATELATLKALYGARAH